MCICVCVHVCVCMCVCCVIIGYLANEWGMISGTNYIKRIALEHRTGDQIEAQQIQGHTERYSLFPKGTMGLYIYTDTCTHLLEALEKPYSLHPALMLIYRHEQPQANENKVVGCPHRTVGQVIKRPLLLSKLSTLKSKQANQMPQNTEGPNQLFAQVVKIDRYGSWCERPRFVSLNLLVFHSEPPNQQFHY